MGSNKIINRFFLGVCIPVILSFFLGDMIWRINLIKTNKLEFPHPRPYYGFLPVPGISPQSSSNGALGADFSQVFLSAKAIRHGESAYNPKNPKFIDRFGRRPNYPPLTNWLYIPLTYLPYCQALLIHNIGTMILFFILTVFLMKKFGLSNYIWKVLITYLLLYFYTTLGFSHFERGQFDFYVASSFFLIFSCVFIQQKGIIYAALASGFFGALKWSSVPFLGTFSVFAFLGTNPRKRWVFILILGILSLSVLAFLPEIRQYWPSLQQYEFSAKPAGLSFVYLMPKTLAKSIQILSTLIIIVIFMLFSQKQRRIGLFKSISLPFALSMAIQGMCFGTVSYEYRVVSMLGLIPAFVLWTEKANDVPLNIKILVATFFAIFLIVTFRVFDFFLWNNTDWRPVSMSALYLFSSLFCLGLCVYIIIKSKVSFVTDNSELSGRL